jgi:hypothetical protein
MKQNGFAEAEEGCRFLNVLTLRIARQPRRLRRRELWPPLPVFGTATTRLPLTLLELAHDTAPQVTRLSLDPPPSAETCALFWHSTPGASQIGPPPSCIDRCLLFWPLNLHTSLCSFVALTDGDRL